MPPLQVFTDVLRLDRPKKPINNEDFADTEMWKEVISKREQFDISEADIFHYFSQKALMPPSVLVGGHNPVVINPFQVTITVFIRCLLKFFTLWQFLSNYNTKYLINHL